MIDQAEAMSTKQCVSVVAYVAEYRFYSSVRCECYHKPVSPVCGQIDVFRAPWQLWMEQHVTGCFMWTFLGFTVFTEDAPELVIVDEVSLLGRPSQRELQ